MLMQERKRSAVNRQIEKNIILQFNLRLSDSKGGV